MSSIPATLQHGWWVGVVDDDGSVRRAIARFLRQHEIPVETFSSAEEYLGSVFGVDPCCLILDIHLGGLTGFELQDYLTSREIDIPVVFMTGHEEISAAQLASRAGTCGFLRKPFEGRALLALVSQYLPNVYLEQFSP